MKSIVSLLAVVVLIAFSVIGAFAADVAPAAPAAQTATSFFTWIAANNIAVLGLLLAVSEFMALIPGIKGNGILDMFIKVLKSALGKPE